MQLVIFVNHGSDKEGHCAPNPILSKFLKSSNPYVCWHQWFELYSEFLDNPFYISGESYAGVYVPTLASEVVKGMKNRRLHMSISLII